MRPRHWALLTLAALATGVGLTQPAVRYVMGEIAVHDGPWLTSAGTGSMDADLYERAAVAVAGLYALSRAETVYYTAFTDDDGAPLTGRCDYRVSGQPPPARWWSLTLYGADHYLVANPQNLYSRHAANLKFAGDGSFSIPVSAAGAVAENLLPAPANAAFSLTLRLYQPAADAAANLATLELPSIKRASCR